MVLTHMVTDPWLKRQKKIGKKKEKRKRKSKKKPDADSDDNIDSQFDKALEAAGLMGKSDNSRNPFKCELYINIVILMIQLAV